MKLSSTNSHLEKSNYDDTEVKNFAARDKPKGIQCCTPFAYRIKENFF